MRHIILEVYCLPGSESPRACCPCSTGEQQPGAHCFASGPNHQRCPNLAFTPAEHEVAYAGTAGVVNPDDWIGFGGEMDIEGQDRDQLLDIWKSICVKKIAECYEEYCKAARLRE